MADTKLSDLTAATTLDTSDEFYVNDSGTSKRITKGNMQTGADAKFVSGTAGSSGQLGQWNADGDLVGWALSVDLTADVTGVLPIANGGTGGSTASAARTALGVDAAGTDNSTDVTLAGSYDYLTLSGQQITLGQVDLSTDVTGTLPEANGGTGVTSLPAGNLVGTSATQTLTNKTINAGDNTLQIETASYSTNQTLTAAQCYGGVIYVTDAATITLPSVADGMSVTVVTIGAVAVSVDPNASDLIYLDGTALDDGDKITNASTAGDIAVLTYYSADGWHASTNGWTDGGA